MSLIHLPGSPKDYVINFSVGNRVISIVGTKEVNPPNTDDGFYDAALSEDVTFSDEPQPTTEIEFDEDIPPVVFSDTEVSESSPKRPYSIGHHRMSALADLDYCRCQNRSMKTGGFTRNEDGLWVHSHCQKATKTYLDAMQYINVVKKPELVEA